MSKAAKNPASKPEGEADGAGDVLRDLDIAESLEVAAGELMGGEGGFALIYRAKPGGRFAFIKEVGADEFTVSWLQETYGGGDYLVKLKDAQRRYHRQGRVLIDETAKPAAAAAPTPSASDAVLAALNKQAELLGRLVEKLSERPAVDPSALRNGLLDDLVKFKNILGGGGGASVDTVFKSVSQALEFSKSLNADGASGWDVVRDVVKEAAGPIAETVQTLVQAGLAKRRTIAPSGKPAAPAAPAALAAVPPEVLSSAEGAPVKIPAKYVAMLIEKAAEDADPLLYADLIIDNVPETLIRSVLAAGIVPALAAVDPRVNDRAEWFQRLGAGLSEALEAQDDAAAPGGPTSGDG